MTTTIRLGAHHDGCFLQFLHERLSVGHLTERHAMLPCRIFQIQ